MFDHRFYIFANRTVPILRFQHIFCRSISRPVRQAQGMNIPEHKVLRLSFCVIMAAALQSEATVTLTNSSSPPCFGQTYKLTCTHPVLDADTNVRWERNGTGFNPQSTLNHDGDDPTPTTTTLTINVTREEFEYKVYNYRCFTVNTSTDTVVRVYSNNITLDPPEMPSSPFILEDDVSINFIVCNWTSLIIKGCFNRIEYECNIKNNIVSKNYYTEKTSFKFDGLPPETQYIISITALAKNRSIRSEPAVMYVTTLSSNTEEENEAPSQALTVDLSKPLGSVLGIFVGVAILCVIVLSICCYRSRKKNRAKTKSQKMSKINQQESTTTYAELNFHRNLPSLSPRNIPNENFETIYTETCSCCTASNGCPSNDLYCQECNRDLREVIFTCGHSFCSTCTNDHKQCPICSETLGVPVTLKFKQAKEKSFCMKCQVHLCQCCYIQDRPVVAVCKCGHQVCKLCSERGCSQCNEKKFIGIKIFSRSEDMEHSNDPLRKCQLDAYQADLNLSFPVNSSNCNYTIAELQTQIPECTDADESPSSFGEKEKLLP